MSEVEIELRARVAALEHIVTCLVANELATSHHEEAARLQADILSRCGYASADPGFEVELAVAKSTAGSLSRLVLEARACDTALRRACAND